jgi:flagellar protein FliS
MRVNGYQTCFDDEVREASPLKLILLLYKAALDSIASARRYLRAKDIRARSRAITKAVTIVNELSFSLNHEDEGGLSRNLANIYAYIGKLLIRANFEQCEPPLLEAERLLSTLLEAWTQSERIQ